MAEGEFMLTVFLVCLWHLGYRKTQKLLAGETVSVLWFERIDSRSGTSVWICVSVYVDTEMSTQTR